MSWDCPLRVRCLLSQQACHVPSRGVASCFVLRGVLQQSEALVGPQTDLVDVDVLLPEAQPNGDG